MTSYTASPPPATRRIPLPAPAPSATERALDSCILRFLTRRGSDKLATLPEIIDACRRAGATRSETIRSIDRLADTQQIVVGRMASSIMIGLPEKGAR
jgi:hypothetical protein